MDNLEDKFQTLQLHCSELTNKLASSMAIQKDLERRILEMGSIAAENEFLRCENEQIKDLQQNQKKLQAELAHAKHVLESITTSPTFKLSQKIASILKMISRIFK